MPTAEERDNLRPPEETKPIDQAEIYRMCAELNKIIADKNSLPRPNPVDVRQLLADTLGKELAYAKSKDISSRAGCLPS